MKELLKQYAAYHIWAQQNIIALVQELDEQHYNRKVLSSFDSVLTTLHHMWDAELIWWQRLQLSKNIVRPDVKTQNIKVIIDGLFEIDNQWQQYVTSKSEPELLVDIEYATFAGKIFKQPVFQILLHVFNHATYHRGQLVNIFHQIGLKNIPPTDFIVWSRTCQ